MEPACRRGDCTFLGDRDNALEVLEFEMIVVVLSLQELRTVTSFSSVRTKFGNKSC
jgi:hypothetical protein